MKTFVLVCVLMTVVGVTAFSKVAVALSDDDDDSAANQAWVVEARPGDGEADVPTNSLLWLITEGGNDVLRDELLGEARLVDAEGGDVAVSYYGRLVDVAGERVIPDLRTYGGFNLSHRARGWRSGSGAPSLGSGPRWRRASGTAQQWPGSDAGCSAA